MSYNKNNRQPLFTTKSSIFKAFGVIKAVKFRALRLFFILYSSYNFLLYLRFFMGTPLDFLNIMSGLGAVVDIGTNLWKTKYNYDMNQRDFDYQKSLQEQIFQREDTAVQRRMADLQAAGLNPNLAAGSAAGAGSVVSRSSTNDLNPGSVLDSIMAANQIKLQKQETINKQKEYEILKRQDTKLAIDNAFSDMSNQINLAMLYKQLGFDYTPFMTRDGTLGWTYKDGYADGDNIMFKKMQEDLKYLESSNKYLEKELKWQTAEKFADMVGVASNFIPKVNFSHRR